MSPPLITQPEPVWHGQVHPPWFVLVLGADRQSPARGKVARWGIVRLSDLDKPRNRNWKFVFPSRGFIRFLLCVTRSSVRGPVHPPVQSQLSLPIEPWQHLSGFPATRPPSVYKGALPAGLRKRRTEGCLHTSITGQTPLQLLAPGWWAGEGGLSFLLLLGPEPSGPVMCPVRGCGCWNQAVFSEKPDSGSRGGQSCGHPGPCRWQGWKGLLLWGSAVVMMRFLF